MLRCSNSIDRLFVQIAIYFVDRHKKHSSSAHSSIEFLDAC